MTEVTKWQTDSMTEWPSERVTERDRRDWTRDIEIFIGRMTVTQKGYLEDKHMLSPEWIEILNLYSYLIML